MNMLEAMRETLSLMEERVEKFDNLNDGPKPTRLGHLTGMLEKMEAGQFSEAKMGRWLGYAQGVMVARSLATLNEMKEINKRWAA